MIRNLRDRTGGAKNFRSLGITQSVGELFRPDRPLSVYTIESLRVRYNI